MTRSDGAPWSQASFDEATIVRFAPSSFARNDACSNHAIYSGPSDGDTSTIASERNMAINSITSGYDDLAIYNKCTEPIEEDMLRSVARGMAAARRAILDPPVDPSDRYFDYYDTPIWSHAA